MADPATLIGGGIAVMKFLDWLNQGSSIDKAADKQYAALNQAQGAIQGYADKAENLQKPYTQNAGQDFQQMRGLVQSGFFQQPYGKSFTSQSYSPQGFSFNPGQGSASFAPWQPQGGPATFTPQALPTMPQFAPPPTPQTPQAGTPQTNPMFPNMERMISIAKAVQQAQQAGAIPNPGAMDMHRNPLQPNPLAPANPFGPTTVSQVWQQDGRGSGSFDPRFSPQIPGPRNPFPMPGRGLVGGF